MNKLQTGAVLTYLVERMRAAGGWAGETHVQKSAFVAQRLASVLTGFEFILYKHGPFSFDLRDELTSLRADGLLVLEPQPFPYGPKFKATEAAQDLQRRFPKTIGAHKDVLDYVSRALAGKAVDELERLATAFLAIDKLPGKPDQERAQWINQRKPHVPPEEAMVALQEAHLLTEQYHEQQSS